MAGQPWARLGVAPFAALRSGGLRGLALALAHLALASFALICLILLSWLCWLLGLLRLSFGLWACLVCLAYLAQLGITRDCLRFNSAYYRLNLLNLLIYS